MEGLSRKEQIKQVAAHMFRKRGYKATSMRDIASEMGMEAPSLYNHIAGKQQILSELLMMIANAFTEGMKQIKSSPLDSLQKLERLIKLHVDITIDHTDAVSLLTNEWVHMEGINARKFKKLKNDYEKDFKRILETCVFEGKLKKVNVDLALFSILSTLRWLYSWYSKNPKVNRIKLEQQMTLLLVPIID
ncbi:MAG: TetR/AcrR family transcriptional regulator [Flavobacteriales bacterium]|nr:TetR/AcrR family transcriptional regulator [Flavobacteriales bacterium]